MWYKHSHNVISQSWDNYDDYDEGEISQENSEQADNLARAEDIYIYRGRELSDVVRDDSGKTIGALWTEWNYSFDENDEPVNKFTFDVVVDPAHRRKGIASDLVKQAILEYENSANEMFGNSKIYAQVVRPEMKELLEKKFGWHVKNMQGNSWIMEPN